MDDLTWNLLKSIRNYGTGVLKQIKEANLSYGYTTQGIEARYIDLLPYIDGQKTNVKVTCASEYCSIEKDDEGNTIAIKVWFDKEKNELLTVNKLDEEFDSSLAMWNFYNEVYGSIFSNLKTESIIKEIKKARDGSRYLRYYKRIGGYKLGGEIDFNFSDKSNKLAKYKKIVNCNKNLSDEMKGKILFAIDMAGKHHHSVENVSLMISDGNVQYTKQQIGEDRFDVFAYALDEYCKGITTWIFTHCTPENMEQLKRYLDIRCDIDGKKNVNKYFEEIYVIKGDEADKLVSELIDSGKKTINSSERVLEYILLAYKVWVCRAKYYEKHHKAVYENLNGYSVSKLEEEKKEVFNLLNELRQMSKKP